MRKVFLYIAVSRDGYIADKNGSVDFLPKVDQEMAEDFKLVSKRADTILFGKNVYDQIISWKIPWPYNDFNSYLFTHKKIKDKNVVILSGDVKSALNDLLHSNGRDIWLMGGANLINQFVEQDLIDEYIITEIPINLKEGIKLFSTINPLKNKTPDLVEKVSFLTKRTYYRR